MSKQNPKDLHLNNGESASRERTHPYYSKTWQCCSPVAGFRGMKDARATGSSILPLGWQKAFETRQLAAATSHVQLNWILI